MHSLALISLIVYLVVLAVIGYTMAVKRRRLTTGKTEDYYIGGRSLGAWTLLFTILASLASAGTFIGGAGVAYKVGYGWVLAGLAWLPGAIFILGPLSKKFAIIARKLGSVTVTDVLRHRYKSNFVVFTISLGILVFLIAYMVAQFVAGARLLQSVTGLPYTAGVLVFGGFVVVYTAFGGFSADVVSDLLQGLIMLVGSIAVWAVILSATSFANISANLQRTNPELLTLPGAGDLTLLLLASYWIVFGVGFAALPHVAVRGMSYKDTRSMHKAMLWGPIVGFIFGVGFTTMGVAARVLKPGLESADLALPLLIMEYLPAWLAGALLAAPVAAIMSTVDSMLLVVSSTIIKDLYVNYVKPGLPDKTVSRMGALTSSVVGVIVLLVSLRPPGLVQFIVIFAIGGLQATLFWPLLLGLYWRRGNTLGAALAIVGGFVSYLLMQFPFPSWALGMDPLVVSLLLSGILYLLGSLLGPPPDRDVLVKFWGTDGEVKRLARTSSLQKGR